MKTYVLLLRGINVGGRNSLKMPELSLFLEKLGCREVQTYIQSGNALFRHPSTLSGEFAELLCSTLEKQKGFSPSVLILPFPEFVEAIGSNPFPEMEGEPKSLHLGFLNGVANHPDIPRMDSLASDTEKFQLLGNRFYLAAPDGIGKSKLAAGAEKCLGVPMTMRNWRTVCKIREMGE